MLIYGANVNKKKLTHEFYMEKISAEKLRQAEEQAKAAQKAANEAQMAKKIWAILINWLKKVVSKSLEFIWTQAKSEITNYKQDRYNTTKYT